MDDEVPTGDGSNTGRGKSQLVNQLWMVTLVTRNVRNASGTGSNDEAGELLSQVLSTLQGWQPSPEHGHLHRRKSPYRATYRNGFCYFTFLFATKVAITGQD